MTVAILASYSFALASPALAKVGSSVGWLYREDPDAPPDLYADYELGPVEQWLNQWDLRDYRAARKSGKCVRAEIVLRKAFKLRYPNGPDPLRPEPDYGAFGDYAIPRHYPDLAVCGDTQRLDNCLAKLRQLGQPPKRFPQHRKSSREDDATPEQYSCRQAVSRIVHLSMRDIGHAHLKLVALSDEGAIIRLTPEYRYYALLRAQTQRVPSDKLAGWLDQSRVRLDASTQSEIEARAASGTWPQSDPLVLDGQRGSLEIWLRWLFRLLTGVG